MCNYKSILNFDLDENNALDITEKNIELIKFILKNDKKYMSEFSEENNHIKNFIIDHKKTTDKEEILQIVKLIDKENSTHQNISGKNKGDNRGYEITAEKICKIVNFYKDLENGKPELVNKIAKSIDTRYTYSFASKYCSYMSRYLFNKDNYSIYDNVINNILPYYAYIYVDEYYIAKKCSNINTVFFNKQNGDYKKYQNLIDRIIEKVNEKKHFTISRKDFDYLLWGYYKNSNKSEDLLDIVRKKYKN